MLKSVFTAGFNRFFCLTFGDNYVKTNKDTTVRLATKKRSPETEVYGDIRFMRIFATVLA